ncbi:MAG: VOC family protein [Gammaproteobacteria bacterium]|nr:MAG: VOC family protein [Gammaproteobacteria bacterium]
MQLLEHIHISVKSIDRTEAFLLAAVPAMRRRGGGVVDGYGTWVHLGTEQSYIALTESVDANSMPELRHIGLVVDDIEALINRLAEAGYTPADDSAVNGHPYRRRVYYVDGNGLDWEFVQYLSDDPALRNDYSQ